MILNVSMCVFRFYEDALKVYPYLLLCREKKASMKGEGRGARELQEHFAFILVKDPSVMTKIAQEGVKTKAIAFNALGKCHTSISNGNICGYLSILIGIVHNSFLGFFSMSHQLERRNMHMRRLL